MISELKEDHELQPLDLAVAQMIPISKGQIPAITIHAHSNTATNLNAEIRLCSRVGNYTPDETVASFEFPLREGRNCLQLNTVYELSQDQYVFLLLHKNPLVKIPRSRKRITGLLSVFNSVNPAVSNYGKQEPPDNIGMDSFEFWCPQRRPAGQNLAFKISKPLKTFASINIKNGTSRPTTQPNAWVADLADPHPAVKIDWKKPVKIKTIVIEFDTDFDHPMETVLMQHPENVMPYCIRNYRIYDDKGTKVAEKKGNYQTRNRITLDDAITSTSLKIEVDHPSPDTPAAIFSVCCLSE